MRILLLPLTRRHTLLYGQRLTTNESNRPSPWVTWIATKTQKTWLEWGKSKTRWKQKTVGLGNKLLARIDWEEYSLRTIPDPRSTMTEKVSWSQFSSFWQRILIKGSGGTSDMGKGESNKRDHKGICEEAAADSSALSVEMGSSNSFGVSPFSHSRYYGICRVAAECSYSESSFLLGCISVLVAS
jgi:Mitochondrial K+-H+ exchange-related